jgi:hypothetical protein
MTIEDSKCNQPLQTSPLTSSAIAAAMDPSCKAGFLQLVHVLCPPSDRPGTGHVADVALMCVNAYRKSVAEAANESLQDVVSEIELVARALQALDLPPPAKGSLRRRLAKFPAWAMLVELPSHAVPSSVLEGIGAQLCLRWKLSTPFSPSLARNLRQAINVGSDLSDRNTVAFKQLASSVRKADEIFKTYGAVENAAAFEMAARQWFRNRLFYGSNKAQQAVCDNRTQSDAQFCASAQWLRQRVQAGDPLATLACVGALLALRPDLVARVPLLNPQIDDNWLMCIDVRAGCIHFSRELFVEGGAKPAAKSSGDTPASDIYVTPLPQFLHDSLQHWSSANPDAMTLGDLIPCRVPLESHTRTLDQNSRIAPTFARFRNSFGPFAVVLGIDRFVGGVVTHDPRLAPTGRFFYAMADRQELWAASATLFTAIGWEPPVPLVEGLPGGSQVTPLDDTVHGWIDWLYGEVEAKRPDATNSITAAFEFHNVYALAIGSLLSFMFALRERKILPINGATALGRGLTLALSDKNCGAIPGRRPVPLAKVTDQLIADWLAHLEKLDVLLAKFGLAADSPERAHLHSVLAGAHVPLLTTIERGRHKPVGTSMLHGWWPMTFGLAPNFGRHFIQNGLRRLGIPSTVIDLYVRHSLRGIPNSSSARTQSLATHAATLSEALEALFRQVGIRRILGLPTCKGDRE